MISGAASAALGWLALSLFFPSSALAEMDGSATGCEFRNFLAGYYLLENRRVFDDEKFVAIVHKLDPAVYKGATGDARSAKTLHFSQHLTIADPGEGMERLKIKDVGGEVLGWVSRDAVFCKMYPMSDSDSGLYRRAVVRTEAAARGQVQVKRVFQSPDERCEGGPNGCVDVGRFQAYFIYAEESGHYLISEAANLGNSQTQLMGWLPVADAYNWNTALGVRPAEDLATRHANPQDPRKEAFICAYRTREDLNRHSNCIEIAGGHRWFDLDVRMLVLKEENQIYEVIFPSRGLGMEGVSKLYIPVSDDVVPEMLISRDQLERLIKTLDVFKTFAGRTHGQASRDLLVNTLLTSLGSMLQIDFQNDQVPLKKQIQFAAGLPHGAQSILMQYSPGELQDPAKVPACEIDYLAQYGAKKHDILNIVFESNGKMLAGFDEMKWPEGSCPNLSDKGKNVPFIAGVVRPIALNSGQDETNRTIMRKIKNDFLFWIPVRYLP